MKGTRDRQRTIWMLNHYAAAGLQAGGNRHIDLAKALLPHDWRTEIFTCSFDHVSREYIVPTSWRRPVITQEFDGILVHRVHSVPYYENSWRRYLNMAVFCFYLLLYCLVRRPKPNAVLGSSGHLLTPMVGWMVARRYRVRFILEVRDLWPDSLIQLGLTSKPIITVLRWMESFLYAHADLIVGVSQGIVAGIVRNGGDPAKTVLISHGVETDPSRAAVVAQRNAIRDELGWGDEFVVLWAGSIEPFNALDVVVDAAALLDPSLPVKIVLLGGGSEFAALEQRSAALANVTMHPSVSRAESFRWMVAADAGLLVASPFDAFTGTRPRKIFDYMAAHLPVLCFVPGEAAQIVSETGAGLARDWATPELVAETVDWCARHASELDEMGERGAEAAATDYSLEHSADLLLQHLNAQPQST